MCIWLLLTFIEPISWINSQVLSRHIWPTLFVCGCVNNWRLLNQYTNKFSSTQQTHLTDSICSCMCSKPGVSASTTHLRMIMPQSKIMIMISWSWLWHSLRSGYHDIMIMIMTQSKIIPWYQSATLYKIQINDAPLYSQHHPPQNNYQGFQFAINARPG